MLKGSMFHFASKCLQNGRKLQKKSKMSQSCAKVAFRGKNARLQKKAKVALRNIAIFWEDYVMIDALAYGPRGPEFASRPCHYSTG